MNFKLIKNIYIKYILLYIRKLRIEMELDFHGMSGHHQKPRLINTLFQLVHYILH